jgi:hypothetical protein
MFTAIFCMQRNKSFISNWITFFHCWENRQILDIGLELDREKSQKTECLSPPNWKEVLP